MQHMGGNQEKFSANREGRLALVTGGNGFIGSHLVEALVKKGYRVRCLIRKTSNLIWLNDIPVEISFGDVTDPASLQAAAQGIDYAYHLAGAITAKKAEDFYRVNVQGTENLIKACLERAPGLKRFILASSQSAAGPCSDDSGKNEMDRPCPITHYGRSNLEAEQVLLSYGDSLPVSLIRPPSVYGPRDTMILTYFRIVKRGIKPLLGFTRPKFISLCHVSDLVRGFLLAGENRQAIGQVYFIGDGEIYSRAEVLDAIAEALSVRPVTVHLPDCSARILAGCSSVLNRLAPTIPSLSLGKALELTQRYWLCDISKARRELGYEPQIGLQEGIRMTADWYRQQGWL